MACACKVNQQIDYLHKKYGDNVPQKKMTNIRGSVMAKIENTIIYILAIPLIPIMFIYSAIMAISGKPIHLDKLINRNRRWEKKSEVTG